MVFYKNKKIVIALVLLFVVSMGIFMYTNKFSKTEKFMILKNFENTIKHDTLETIILNSSTTMSSAFVYLSEDKLKVMGNLPLPDGGDYNPTDKFYSVYGDSKFLGNLKRRSDGWLYLEISRPKTSFTKYTIKIDKEIYLQN